MAESKDKKTRPTVGLVGEDGNAYEIMSKVRKALKLNGYTPEEIEKYTTEAKSGDYDNLLCVTMEWVDVV